MRIVTVTMFLRLDVNNHGWSSQTQLHLLSLVSALLSLVRSVTTVTVTAVAVTSAGRRTQDGEEDWQSNETMEQSKDADEKEDLEE